MGAGLCPDDSSGDPSGPLCLNEGVSLCSRPAELLAPRETTEPAAPGSHPSAGVVAGPLGGQMEQRGHQHGGFFPLQLFPAGRDHLLTSFTMNWWSLDGTFLPWNGKIPCALLLASKGVFSQLVSLGVSVHSASPFRRKPRACFS